MRSFGRGFLDPRSSFAGDSLMFCGRNQDLVQKVWSDQDPLTSVAVSSTKSACFLLIFAWNTPRVLCFLTVGEVGVDVAEIGFARLHAAMVGDSPVLVEPDMFVIRMFVVCVVES